MLGKLLSMEIAAAFSCDAGSDSSTRLVAAEVADESNAGTGGKERGDRTAEVVFGASFRDCMGDCEVDAIVDDCPAFSDAGRVGIGKSVCTIYKRVV